MGQIRNLDARQGYLVLQLKRLGILQHRLELVDEPVVTPEYGGDAAAVIP